MKGFVVFLVVVGLAVVAMPGAASAVRADDGCPAPSTAANGSNAGVEPGQQLAGVLGDQQSAVDAELDGRNFEARLENATNDEERAKVVATEVEAIVQRLDELETGCEDLTSRLDENEISEGTYRTKMGRVDARAGVLTCRLNRSQAAAEPLPADLRDEHAINETVFGTVGERIDRLDAFAAEESGSADSGIENPVCSEDQSSDEPQPSWPW